MLDIIKNSALLERCLLALKTGNASAHGWILYSFFTAFLLTQE